MGTNFNVEEFNRLFRQASSVKEDTYLQSPMYYALTGRRGAWVHEGYGSVLVVCCHPNVPDRLLVFPEIGEASGKLVASVLDHLEIPAGGVQLAKFTDSDFACVKEAIAEKNYRSVQSIAIAKEGVLDWEHPIHILNTHRVSSMEGSSFSKIRNKFRKVAEHVNVLGLSNANALRFMMAAHKYWEGSMIFKNKANGMDISSFYERLFVLIQKYPTCFEGNVYLEKNRPIGFTIWDIPYAGTANLLASMCDTSIAGLADYQIVTTCQSLAREGVGLLNFGGSETESLDAFKKKFAPEKSIRVFSAEVSYQRKVDDRVRSRQLTF